MKIRKVDDNPMVIHTKEKAKIHAHEPKGAKIKGSNIYTVERGPKTAGAKVTNTDSSKMAEVIGVSEAQLRFVTNTASGMGLIKCGSVVIPFDNQISKDTDLYRLYNTNIHEKIAEQKKREMQNNVE